MEIDGDVMIGVDGESHCLLQPLTGSACDWTTRSAGV